MKNPKLSYCVTAIIVLSIRGLDSTDKPNATETRTILAEHDRAIPIMTEFVILFPLVSTEELPVDELPVDRLWGSEVSFCT
jgi:hypothetical protein